MSRIHTGLKGAKFENPGAISTATICSATGKKANTGCPNTYTEYFLWFTVPEICNEHNGSEIKNNENINKNNVTEIIKGTVNSNTQKNNLNNSTNTSEDNNSE